MILAAILPTQRTWLARFREAFGKAGWVLNPSSIEVNEAIDMRPECSAQLDRSNAFLIAKLDLAEAVSLIVGSEEPYDFIEIIFDLDHDFERVISWIITNASVIDISNYPSVLQMLVPFPSRVGVKTGEGSISWFGV